MRKSRVFAFVVASLVSSAAVVQAQGVTPPARAARQELRGGIGGGRGAGGVLRGITLSDTEKASLKAIHAKYRLEGKSLRESLKPAMREARAARQKGDTVGAKAVWERNKGARQQVEALRDRQRAEIRAALTPEHQTMFDANIARAEQRRAEFARNGGRPGKGMRGARGHHGEKGGRKTRRIAPTAEPAMV